MKHNIHGTKRNIIIFRREGGGKKWRGLSCGRDYFGFLTTYRVVRGKEEMRLFIDQWQKKRKEKKRPTPFRILLPSIQKLMLPPSGKYRNIIHSYEIIDSFFFFLHRRSFLLCL